MPANVSWFVTLPEIIRTVETSSLPAYDRRALEQLLSLRHSAAAKLLPRIPGCYRAGQAWLVGRRELLMWLRQIIESKAWQPEMARRKRVLEAIEPERQRIVEGRPRTVVAVPARTVEAIERTNLDSLPPGVRVSAGRIEIQFSCWEDMLLNLAGLIHAIDNDALALRAIVEGKPHA